MPQVHLLAGIGGTPRVLLAPAPRLQPTFDAEDTFVSWQGAEAEAQSGMPGRGLPGTARGAHQDVPVPTSFSLLRQCRTCLGESCLSLMQRSLVGQAAKDYRADAELLDACEPDAEQLCADVKPGEGRVQDCLVRTAHPG